MFNKGDIVEIYNNGTMAMPDSPVLNLEGTVAEIVDVRKNKSLVYYWLKFIDIKAEKPELVKGDEEHLEKLYWRDHHLRLLTGNLITNVKIDEDDIMDLLH